MSAQQQQGSNLEKVFEAHYSQFERGVRQQQRNEFNCCAKCTENPNMTAEQYNQCLQQCKAPLNALSEAVQGEIGRFQVRAPSSSKSV